MSPTLTIRGVDERREKEKDKDRGKWKTLRDFVDERAIEDVLDAIESDRNVLDVSSTFHSLPMSLLTCMRKDTLAVTDAYPENLNSTISTIQNALPYISSLPSINDILESQAQVSTHMASHLESLAAHYDQMAEALRESEAGEAFSEEDLQGQHVFRFVFIVVY